jgi:hypothetical protein
MKGKILYHGSPLVLQRPDYAKGKQYNDYGKGLYCTEHLELAKEWACTNRTDGFANRYEFSESGLRILRLSAQKCPTLHWLALLLENRRGRMTDPVIRQRAEWLHDHFLLDTQDYDAIVGYRGDDSYFSFARAFLKNEISLTQLSQAMKLGSLGEQYVLKSPRAFAAIQFCSYERVDHSEYYAKRKARDEEARCAYRAVQKEQEADGLFLSDLLQEEVSLDDQRIQC